MSNIISFYLDPFKEAIDFYKQLLKYGNYDPDRYFKLNYGTLSAKEALSLSKPIFDAQNLRKEKYYIEGLNKLIKKAVKSGEMHIYLPRPTLRVENYTVRNNVIKHFKDLGYDLEHEFYSLSYLDISWKYK